MRGLAPLSLLALAACAPGKFDHLVGATSAANGDGGGALGSDASADGSPASPDASLDAARANDEAGAVLVDAGRDASTTASDAAPPPMRDECGQRLPSPEQFGFEDGGVAMLAPIALSTFVQPQYPTSVVTVGDEDWWLFKVGFAPNSVYATSTDSIAKAPKAMPYVLDVAAANAPAPTSFIPLTPADRDALASGELLMHETGNIMMTGPNDGLLFYAPTALGFKDGQLYPRGFGTRLANVHFENGSAQATALPTLVFGPDKPAFRYGIIDGGYVYLYGCSDAGFGTSTCVVARAPQAQAAQGASYQFLSSAGWSNDFTFAAPVLDRTRDDLSISYNPFLRRYLAVHQLGLASEIYLLTATAASGPWEPLGSITLPPPLQQGAAHAGALEQPALATQCGRRLVLTYLFSKNGSDNELRHIEVTLREGS